MRKAAERKLQGGKTTLALSPRSGLGGKAFGWGDVDIQFQVPRNHKICYPSTKAKKIPALTSSHNKSSTFKDGESAS